MQPSPHCTVILIYFSVVNVLEFNKRGFVTVVQKNNSTYDTRETLPICNNIYHWCKQMEQRQSTG